MKTKFSIASIFTIFFDCTGAFLLTIYAILIGPLGFLRGPLMFERILWYVGVFVPMGAMTRSIRVAVDWRLGHFEIAIAQAEAIIRSVEKQLEQRPSSYMRKRVLMDFYTLLARAYMHIGRIDEAMQVVLRAKKVLDIDKLIGLPELDAKTAHLVRAGLAAGKLLDGGGLATMFVKANTKEAESSHHTSAQSPTNDKKHTAHHDQEKAQDKTAKIIPFPTGDCVL